MSKSKKPTTFGRPPKPKEERHDQKVTIYLTEQERDNVAGCAEDMGMAPATLIRSMITRSNLYRNFLLSNGG